MSKRELITGLGGDVRIKARTAKQPARFDALIYTGTALNIGGYDRPVVIDLANLTLGKLLIANLDHDTHKRVGTIDQILNDGRTLRARGTANAATKASREVVQSAKRGYKWQASVEVNPTKLETIKVGESVQVNGRSFKGPLYVTRAGILKGFGFVTHGADDDTTVNIAAKNLRPLAARVAALPSPELRRAIAGAVTVLVLEQLSGIDGDTVLQALHAAEVEPAFTHAAVNHFPVVASIFAIQEFIK